MSALGELVVKLSANIAEFTGAMDKAAFLSEKRMNAMVKQAEAAGAAIGMAMTAAAGSVAVAMKLAVDRMDELGETAQKLGVTTEALSTLEYIASMSGVAIEALHGGISRLNKAVAEGDPAFAAMGISTKNANGELKTADEMLREVAGKFAGYKDGAEKSALAMDILGKSGADLIPMMNQGSEGFSSLSEEAQKMGLVVGGEATEAAGRLNDTLDRIVKTQQGLLTQITTQALPALLQISGAFEEAAKKSSLVNDAVNLTTGFFKVLAVAGAQLVYVFTGVGREIGGIAAQISAIASGNFDQVFAIGTQMELDAEASRREIDRFTESMFSAADQAAKTATGIDNAGKKAAGGVAPIVSATKKLKDASDAAKKAQEALEKEGKSVFEATRTDAEKLATEYERLNRLLDAGVISWDTYGRAVMDAQDKLMPLAENAVAAETQIQKIADTTSNVDIVITDAFQSMADAVATFATGGRVTFSDMVNSMIRDLIRLEIQTQATSAYKSMGGLSGIASAVGSWFSAASGSTYNTNAFSEQSMMLAAQDAGLAGRANGGMVSAGTTYLVGERGPELLTMGSQSGNVSQIGGDQQTIINLSIIESSDKAGQVSQSSNGNGVDLQVYVAKALASDMSRNGPITQGFASTFGLRRAI